MVYTLIVLIAVFAGFALITVLTLTVDRKTGSETRTRLLEKTDPHARVRGLCYMREGYMEEPCAAQVLGEELSIFTHTAKEFHIPLHDLRVTKIKRNNLVGRYPWFWKTVYSIKSPHTSGLRLGVNHADSPAWEQALKKCIVTS